ncbi:hypothetical protein [Clostridium rectalis]|uniref:hypothetical protein n=1 Tax=Clostridium rectalis TaxID=2040295 RepID=UPI000F640754|nr:hypothetical protein [Clostridium rectalis]
MKKIFSTIFIAMYLITMLGCGSNSSKETSSKNDINEKIQQDENKSKKVKSKFEDSNKGRVNIIKNYCEFTIIDTKFGKKINPPKPKNIYTYYEAKEPGTIYFDTTIDVKSLLTEGRRANEFLSVKVIYNEKYEYRTFSAIEKDGGTNFNYTNITSIEPLKNGVIHFIAEVPNEVESDKKPLAVIISVNNREFKYVVR